MAAEWRAATAVEAMRTKRTENVYSSQSSYGTDVLVIPGLVRAVVSELLQEVKSTTAMIEW